MARSPEIAARKAPMRSDKSAGAGDRTLNDFDLMKLRPVDGSSDAIKDPLSRIDAKQQDARGCLQTLHQERGRLLLHGTHCDLEANDEGIKQTGIALERLAAMVERLGSDLSAALKSEHATELRRLYDLVGYEKLVQDFAEGWRATYAKNANSIAELLAVEKLALSKLPRVLQLWEQLVAAGVDIPRPQLPVQSPPAKRLCGRISRQAPEIGL